MTVFKRKIKVTTWPPHQNSSRRDSFKIWFSKWDRTIAGFVAFVIIIAILSLIIYHSRSREFFTTTYNTTRTYFIPDDHQNKPSRDRYSYDMGGCKGSTCSVSCTGSDSKKLADSINAALEDSGNLSYCTQETTLQLSAIQFENLVLSKGWLESVSTTFQKLEISDTNLNEIGAEAFGEFAIKHIKYLTVRNLPGALFLSKNAFLGASSLATIEMSDFSLQVEENVFEAITEKITVFQCMNCRLNEDSLLNITGPGVKEMSYLTSLDLRNNNIKHIGNDTISKTPNLKSLYLSNSKIEKLEAQAFYRCTSILQLYLNNNKLQSLPRGIFRYNEQGIIIYIEGNPFDCNCEFVWFRDYYTANRAKFGDLFKCSTEDGDVIFDKVDFCPNETTTTTPPTTTSTPTKSTTPPITTTTTTTTKTTTPITTTTTTTTPTTTASVTTKTTPPTSTTTLTTTTTPPTTLAPNDGSVLKVICQPNMKDATGVQYEIEIVHGTSEIKFIQEEDSTLYKIQISLLKDSEDNFNLIWIDSQKNIDCLKGIKETANVLLQHEETYTFCLEEDSAKAISPLNCASVTVPPPWDSRTWIPNKLRTIIIGTVCSIFLFASLLSALIMYCCVRQHPSLIKGNKRVIIVKSKSADVTSMPKYYDHPNYVPPSLISYSDGYLTPTNKYYENIRDRSRSTPISTISAYNQFVDVRSPLHSPSVRRYRRHNMRRRARIEQFGTNFEDHLYEPPPLPPNHPGIDLHHCDSFRSFSRL